MSCSHYESPISQKLAKAGHGGTLIFVFGKAASALKKAGKAPVSNVQTGDHLSDVLRMARLSLRPSRGPAPNLPRNWPMGSYRNALIFLLLRGLKSFIHLFAHENFQQGWGRAKRRGTGFTFSWEAVRSCGLSAFPRALFFSWRRLWGPTAFRVAANLSWRSDESREADDALSIVSRQKVKLEAQSSNPGESRPIFQR